MSASPWPSWWRPAPYIAEDAVSLISADVEDLPPVLNWEQAGDRSVLIHDGAGTNTTSIEVGRGDADAAFKAAYYVRREHFTVHRHTAVPLEARGLVAVWDACRDAHDRVRHHQGALLQPHHARRPCSIFRRASVVMKVATQEADLAFEANSIRKIS